jgi:hypothetical protein
MVEPPPLHWPIEELGTFQKQNFLDTPIGFAGANSILGIPLDPGFSFRRIIFTMPTFFARATFTFFEVAIPEVSAFRFLIDAVKVSVPSLGRGE